MIKQPYIVSVQESGKARFELKEDYEINGFKILAGFRCDLASVPRPIRALTGMERRGIHDPASLLHDYLYDCGGVTMRYGKRFQYIREFADKEFHRILRRVNVKSWHASAYYSGVSAFGKSHWRK